MATRKGNLFLAFTGAGMAVAIVGTKLSEPLWAFDPDGARDTLENAGFSDIKIEGHRWFGCGRGDVYKTGFTARNSNGQETSGTVCRGWLKGATIRYN